MANAGFGTGHGAGRPEPSCRRVMAMHEGARWDAVQKEGLETFCTRAETYSDFFVWNQRNPLKSPDSEK
jgi:hypothetical protein